MFDLARKEVEAAFQQDFDSQIGRFRQYRRIALVHYALHAVGAILGLALLTLFASYERLFGEQSQVAIVFWLGAALFWLILVTVSSRSHRVVSKLVSRIYRRKLLLQLARARDPFLGAFWLSALILVVPMAMASLQVLGVWDSGSEAPATNTQLSFLGQLVTFALGLLAAQIALFTFMLDQVLRRYSHHVAESLNEHRVTRLLRLYATLALALPLSALGFGHPSSQSGPLWGTLLVCNFLALLVTMDVARRSIRGDRALVYAGYAAALKVRRILKPPIEGNSILVRLGLEFRDPARFSRLAPPEKMQPAVAARIRPFLSAVDRAIAEEDEEALQASLASLQTVVGAYVSARQGYHSLDDAIFSYLFGRFGDLLRSASACRHQELAAQLVRAVGALGRVALRVGRRPQQQEGQGRGLIYPADHPLGRYWFSLLEQSFVLTHGLKNTSAPGEAIAEAESLALKAEELGFEETVRYSYLPLMQRIHAICIKGSDPYHLSMAGACLKSLLAVWAKGLASQRRSYYWNREFSRVLTATAVEQFRVQPLPSFSLDDAVTAISTRVSGSQPILQDLFAYLLWDVQKHGVTSSRVEELGSLISLSGDLARAALKRRVANVDRLAEAIYEVSYLAFFKAPEIRPNGKVESSKGLEEWAQGLQGDLLDLVEDLLPRFYSTQVPAAHEWRHFLVSIVGLGILAQEQRPNAFLQGKLEYLITRWRVTLMDDLRSGGRVSEDDWDYLQLLGSWSWYLLGCRKLAAGLASEIGHHRRVVISTTGLGSFRSGYPELDLDRRFFLPWLRNLQRQPYLSSADLEALGEMTRKLTDPEALSRYGRRVKRIVNSRREKALSKVSNQANPDLEEE